MPRTGGRLCGLLTVYEPVPFLRSEVWIAFGEALCLTGSRFIWLRLSRHAFETECVRLADGRITSVAVMNLSFQSASFQKRNLNFVDLRSDGITR